MASAKPTKLNVGLVERPVEKPFISILLVSLMTICFYYLGAIVIVAIFSSILLHELGHYLTFKYYGIKVKKVSINIFDNSYVRTSGNSISPKELVLTTVSGPLMGLFPIIALLPMLYLGYNSTSILVASKIVLLLNLLNLFPTYGSDGSKIVTGVKSYIKNKDLAPETEQKPTMISKLIAGPAIIVIFKSFEYIFLI